MNRKYLINMFITILFMFF